MRLDRLLMENKTANLLTLSTVTLLIIFIIIARICLHLSKPFFLILGADIALIFAVLTFIIIRHRFNRRKEQLERQIDSQGRELRIEYSFLRKVAGGPTKFRHKELDIATDGFRYLLGRGGSGSVYKGILSNGTPVAVKRIDGEESGEKAFKSEVMAISNVQHVNLVRLIGYCISPRFIVYEFIPNGSLDKWIFRGKNEGCLSWESRFRVAVDVAKGLSYLHHDCRSCILHLDVKPENILIDENYGALVSDFGLSKLKGREESRVVTNIRGTKGYLAPEWLLGNGVSEKCDVYSYGMVLLEIIGGRKNIRVFEEGSSDNASKRKKFEYFPRIVLEKFREGKVMEIVDERINVEGKGLIESEVMRMVSVALWCIQEKPKLRPTMAQVVEMLQGFIQVDDPPHTKMLLVDLLSIDDPNQRTRLKFHEIEGDGPSTSGCSFAFSAILPR